MNNYIQSGELLTVTAPANVVAGQLIQVGNLCGVCASAADSGDDVEIQTEGCFRLAKATGFVPAAGDPAYFDFGADNRLESSGVPIGFYTHSALTGDTYARVLLDPDAARTAQLAERIRIQPLANKTQTAIFRAPYAGKVIGISYFTGAKPTSSAGGCTLAIKNGVGGNTMLAAATFDLEGATEDAVTSLSLTGTAADLVLAAGGVAEIKIASDNADLVVGEGVELVVFYQRT